MCKMLGNPGSYAILPAPKIVGVYRKSTRYHTTAAVVCVRQEHTDAWAQGGGGGEWRLEGHVG